MDPITGGLIAGGASLLGNIFSSSTSASNTQAQLAAQEQMQMQSEQFNAQQAQIGRDYNTQMSNTAYQRASADMKSAGLNPMMMFGSGSAASTPASPTASVGTPSVPLSQNRGALAGLGDAVSKGIDAMVSAKTMDKMTEEVARMETQRNLMDVESRLQSQRTETEKAETLRRQDQASLTGLAIPAARFSAKSAEDLLDIPDAARKTGNIASWGGRKVEDVLSPLLSTARSWSQMNESRSRRGMPSFGESFSDRFNSIYGHTE